MSQRLQGGALQQLSPPLNVPHADKTPPGQNQPGNPTPAIQACQIAEIGYIDIGR